MKILNLLDSTFWTKIFPLSEANPCKNIAIEESLDLDLDIPQRSCFRRTTRR